jgi:TrmH family RNA methyltransferase
LITSLQNQQVKDVVRLGSIRERRIQNLFVIEGARELSLAIAGGFVIRSLFVCDGILSGVGEEMVRSTGFPVEKVSAEVFKKMAYREASDGIIAVAESRPLRLKDIRLSEQPFVIVLEAVEKPGNLGAILRTADAAHVDAIIVCDPKTDIYNPNVIRSSIGCVFTQQVVACTSEEAFGWLRQSHVNILAAELAASEWYYLADFTKPSAVVMGTEAGGLTGFWLGNADRRIKIPMRGRIDSLNVSVSTAVITFEAMRQRNFMQ